MHMWKEIYGKQPFRSYHCKQKILGLPFSKVCESETITVNRDFDHTTNHFYSIMLQFEILKNTHLHLFTGCCVRQQHLLHSGKDGGKLSQCVRCL